MKLATILSPKTFVSNESIKQKSKEPINDDDTNTRIGSMSPLNFDQSSTSSKEMLDNF